MLPNDYTIDGSYDFADCNSQNTAAEILVCSTFAVQTAPVSDSISWIDNASDTCYSQHNSAG